MVIRLLIEIKKNSIIIGERQPIYDPLPQYYGTWRIMNFYDNLKKNMQKIR